MPEIVALFAPQFFLLVGIDFFLAAAIATIILDRYFPNAVPYVMVIGGFVGFSQLLIGPAYLNSFSDVLQFYYCAGFALISLVSLIALNLYLFLLKKKLFESGILSITATIPASLILLYFVDAYVNNISVALPAFPVLPLSVIYIAFVSSVVLVSVLIAMTMLRLRQEASRTQISKKKASPRRQHRSGRGRKNGTGSRAKRKSQDSEPVSDMPIFVP